MGSLNHDYISFRVKLSDSEEQFRVGIATKSDFSGPQIFSSFYTGESDAFDDSGTFSIPKNRILIQ